MNNLVEKAQQDKTTMWLIIALSFLIGIVAGILMAPVKNGLTIGSNNTIIGGGDDDDDKKKKAAADDDELEF